MKIYKTISRLLPFLIILLTLSFAGFTSYVLSSTAQQVKTENISLNDAVYENPEPTPIPQPTQLPVKQKFKPVNTTKPSPEISTNPTPVVTTNPTTSPTPTPSPTPQINQLNISINNSTSFTISIGDGANQCDVLSKSLSDGKISSLNMKYDSRYNTYGVYQINGIGKENQIWWTFSVNGTNPSQGCSQIKANNNDSIVWTYIGPD